MIHILVASQEKVKELFTDNQYDLLNHIGSDAYRKSEPSDSIAMYKPVILFVDDVLYYNFRMQWKMTHCLSRSQTL